VVDGATYGQTFDAKNRLLAATRFVYDGNGQRVLQVAADGSQTAYVGELFEVEIGASATISRSIDYAGSQRVAGCPSFFCVHPALAALQTVPNVVMGGHRLISLPSREGSGTG